MSYGGGGGKGQRAKGEYNLFDFISDEIFLNRACLLSAMFGTDILVPYRQIPATHLKTLV